MSEDTAFVFPGQGSQSVGMLAELAEAYPVVRETFDEASGALDFDLWALTQQGPEESLNETDKTQPALLAGGVAVWRAWREAGGAAPAWLAGHSLGEYTALVCAGALDFPEAVALVAQRGRYMQQAVPAGEGAMAAIMGLSDESVADICQRSADGEVVAPANYNSPGQVVIAGHAGAVHRAAEACKAEGAKKAQVLAVSAPSHCALMAPAAAQLADALGSAEIRAPRVPVVNNVDVRAESEPAAIKDALIRQLEHPVRWVETVQYISGQGASRLLECGPGKVLCGLNKRIERSAQLVALQSPEALAEAAGE